MGLRKLNAGSDLRVLPNWSAVRIITIEYCMAPGRAHLGR